MRYINFCEMRGVNPQFPIDEHELSLFITRLAYEGVQASTIKSYMSGISYLHKFYKMPNPVLSFRVSQLIKGIERTNRKSTHSLKKPITMSLLDRLITSLVHVVDHPYVLAMYAALFCLLYFGCMRVGEAVLSVEEAHVALSDDLWYCQIEGVNYFLLAMRSFKHSDGRTPILKIHPRMSMSCPVYWLNQYLSFRGSLGTNLFQLPDGRALTRDHVMRVLRRALTFLDIDPLAYGTHSFRIGRCTDLACAGYTDQQLRQVGRWKSDAFKLYIRPEIIDC